jgi:hypothetical protein
MRTCRVIIRVYSYLTYIHHDIKHTRICLHVKTIFGQSEQNLFKKKYLRILRHFDINANAKQT